MCPALHPQDEATSVSDYGRLWVRNWLATGETKPHYELISGQLVQKFLKTYPQSKSVGSFSFNT